MFEIIFKNSINNSSKTVRVIASNFDEALKKLKEAGYDSSSYNNWGTEDIVSFVQIEMPNITIF